MSHDQNLRSLRSLKPPIPLEVRFKEAVVAARSQVSGKFPDDRPAV
jgi:hypothetical protein